MGFGRELKGWGPVLQRSWHDKAHSVRGSYDALYRRTFCSTSSTIVASPYERNSLDKQNKTKYEYSPIWRGLVNLATRFQIHIDSYIWFCPGSHLKSFSWWRLHGYKTCQWDLYSQFYNVLSCCKFWSYWMGVLIFMHVILLCVLFNSSSYNFAKLSCIRKTIVKLKNCFKDQMLI